ncbi:YceI family protein [Olivibacter domesticus]|uniref:Polyisoprenoid-binding protein YceI n=1 Tax=Olivibacter domesticus TaxID=407022 RepID=A0A1H7WFD7_OLID1|nr:YceI family protein [Olivibacter domesticus]SEM19785.1 Polyisoprenoid-binding protein YceI [Olivibacter domesticus]
MIQKIVLSLLLIGALSTTAVNAQNTFVSNGATVSFFSSTPLEDIEGISKNGLSALDLSTGAILFKVKNTSFQFKKKLMQEHFNENYMESDQFPFSEFKGKIENPDKLKSDGTYQCMVAGTLTVHGVTKNYTAPVKITVNKGSITAACTFKVKTADHGIEVPTIVIKNIAETLDIKVAAIYNAKTR